MRLIDADAYRAEMKTRQDACAEWRDEAKADRDEELYARAEQALATFIEAKLTLDKMPTIDAVPVVHGEWFAENNRPKSSMFYCSICHRTCNDIQPIRKEGWKKRCRYAYCPNCGAKMDITEG